jgi:hypothetical protein
MLVVAMSSSMALGLATTTHVWWSLEEHVKIVERFPNTIIEQVLYAGMSACYLCPPPKKSHHTRYISLSFVACSCFSIITSYDYE